MSSRLSSSFRLVDFFRLGGAMPEEVVNGHGSQMLNLWVGLVRVESLVGQGGQLVVEIFLREKSPGSLRIQTPPEKS